MKMKKRKKSFDIKKEYKNSWKYMKECKTFIYFIAGIFFIFLLVGFFVPAPDFLYDKIMEYIREILGKTEGMSGLELIWFIISNNITSTFLGIVFGVVLGIFPVVNSVANGYMLGFVSSISVNNGGVWTLWKLFPHGIFELPAVFISLGLGAKLGTFVFQKNKSDSFKNYFTNSLKVFLLIVVPLLILAGTIEGILMILVK
jgi:stage II sporulation protein M